MENIKRIPMVLFFLLGAKLLFLQASWQDILFLATLGVVSCYLEYKNQSEKIKDIETRLKSLEKSSDETRSSVAGLKLSTVAFKTNANR